MLIVSNYFFMESILKTFMEPEPKYLFNFFKISGTEIF